MSTLKREILVFTALLICICSASGYATNVSVVSISHGEYMVKTEIVMPHLQNSLDYTNTQTRQCLGRQQASTLFPILEHVSFAGCSLIEKQIDAENAEFNLACSNPEAATGLARFVINKESFRGTLSIKMGGKNMKFSQRVYGRRIGAC